MSVINRARNIILLSVILVLGALAYLPGITGPYVFDDHTNLLENPLLRLESLDLKNLWHAAFSMSSGPLQRPVAMASFALNSYFAGGFSSPAIFKITNIVIHALNGLLVFWVIQLMLTRYLDIHKKNLPGQINKKTYLPVAAIVAFLWLTHPIQLTSVLYIIQRMTLLSSLFTVLGLIFYLKGRMQIESGNNRGYILMLSGLLGCGFLGVFSKENAALLPVFVLLLEYSLFSSGYPWNRWQYLSIRTRRLLIFGMAAAAIFLFVIAVIWAMPGYTDRIFTMSQRVMTEWRVLFFYLSLILAPRIDQFALLHDDIPLSISLLEPWTTLASLLGIIALLTLAVLTRRRYRLLSLGILWFFAAHLLESTIFALEIAHEHRNYLALFGALLALAGLTDMISAKTRQARWWLVLPLVGLVFVGLTYLRSTQWSTTDSLHRFEASHHPNSPGAQLGLGMLFADQGHYEAGMQAFRRAAELNLSEAGMAINILVTDARQGNAIDKDDQQEVLRRLNDYPATATTVWAIQIAAQCITDQCKTLLPFMQTWLRILIEKNSSVYERRDYYFFYLLGRTLYLQGKINEAIDAYRMSYSSGDDYLPPLFEITNIYLQHGQSQYAKTILDEIHKANQRTPQLMDKEFSEVELKLKQLEKNRKAVINP